MHVSYDFKIFQHNTIPINLTIDDTSGTAIDISGYKFWITIKTNESDSDVNAIVQNTSTAPAGSTDGKITLTLSKTDTDQTAGDYYYDIQMMDLSNSVYTLFKGIVTIETAITGATS